MMCGSQLTVRVPHWGDELECRGKERVFLKAGREEISQHGGCLLSDLDLERDALVGK